mmetsp:Transcript_34954/g.81620  ORF Transcript_34954/g.81620 Transcript_34954/m.81620 type:complete len:208 (+) Transcript_34954:365-988(+)
MATSSIETAVPAGTCQCVMLSQVGKCSKSQVDRTSRYSGMSSPFPDNNSGMVSTTAGATLIDSDMTAVNNLFSLRALRLLTSMCCKDWATSSCQSLGVLCCERCRRSQPRTAEVISTLVKIISVVVSTRMSKSKPAVLICARTDVGCFAIISRFQAFHSSRNSRVTRRCRVGSRRSNQSRRFLRVPMAVSAVMPPTNPSNLWRKVRT